MHLPMKLTSLYLMLMTILLPKVVQTVNLRPGIEHGIKEVLLRLPLTSLMKEDQVGDAIVKIYL